MSKTDVKRKSLRSLLIITVAILLLGYFAFHILQWLILPISTEIALFTEEQEIIEAPGFILRDERLIQFDTEDVLYYQVEDGDHIAEDGVIAEQYKSASDVSARREIERLEKEIEQLKKFDNNSDRAAVNPEQLQTKASEKVMSLLQSINQGNYQNVEKERENTLYALNERLVLYEGGQNFSQRIQTLQYEADKLRQESSESTGRLRAEKPGYFISGVDGYESVFDFDKAESLTPSELSAAYDAVKQPADNAIGKLVESYHWYIALTVSENEAYRIQGKQNGLKLSIASADGMDVPVKLAAINFTRDRSKAAVILRCDYMSKGLARAREGQMQIIIDTHKGLKIPKRALRMRQCVARVLQAKVNESDQPVYKEEKGNYEGVYVRIGETIHWRFIVRLYSGSDYVICSVSPGEFDPQSTPLLTYYDEVIVEGRDLEDGEFIR